MNLKKYILTGFIFVTYCIVLSLVGNENQETVLLIAPCLIILCGWCHSLNMTIFFSVLITSSIGLIIANKPSSATEWTLILNPSSVITSFALGILSNRMTAARNRLSGLTESLEAEIENRTEKLNMLAMSLIEQDESERVRMGQDLHDGVGQYLTGMLLHNEALHMKLAKNSFNEEARMVAKATKMIQDNMRHVSRLARTLFPVKIEQTGIEQALYEMTSYFTETADIDFAIDIRCNVTLIPNRTALNLYRIIHEAVQNALQYGNATRILISLGETVKNWDLAVENNGKPLDPNFKGGMGMQLMTYRARSINGQIKLRNTPNNRVLLQCTVAKQ